MVGKLVVIQGGGIVWKILVYLAICKCGYVIEFKVLTVHNGLKYFVEATLFLFVFIRKLCNGYESKVVFTEWIIKCYKTIIFSIYFNYADHYNPWLVYLLTHFWRLFLYTQGYRVAELKFDRSLFKYCLVIGKQT